MADSLSGVQSQPNQWSLHQQVFKILSLFSPRGTGSVYHPLHHQLPRFVSPFPDPWATAIDGLSLDWTDLDLYAFPPFPIMPKVLQRL